MIIYGTAGFLHIVPFSVASSVIISSCFFVIFLIILLLNSICVYSSIESTSL